MIVRLPYPPSLNTYWRRVGSRTVLSKAARSYRVSVGMVCAMGRVRPVDGPLAIDLAVFRPDNRKRDLDNVLKALFDALEGRAFHDDSQIHEIRARWCGVRKGGEVIVTLRELT